MDCLPVLFSLHKRMDQNVYKLFQTDFGVFVPSSWFVSRMDHNIFGSVLVFSENVISHVVLGQR